MDDIKRPKHRRDTYTTTARQGLGAAVLSRRPEKGAPAASQTKRIISIRVRLPAWFGKFYSAVRRSLGNFYPSRRRHPAIARVGWGLLALIMIVSMCIEFLNWRQADTAYALSDRARTLLGRINPAFSDSLKFDQRSQKYYYNQDYKPGNETAGLTGIPKFTGSFSAAPEKGAVVTDPVSEASVGFKPRFGLKEPLQEQTRLIYPLKGRDATKVYSLKSIGMKEDIILHSYQGDNVDFSYTLELEQGMEARLEPNGSLAIYGVQPELLGNVATGSDQDVALLQKARQKAPKNTLLFTFPAPFVREYGKKVSDAKAWFDLEGNVLTLHASGLQGSSYPLSIDPTIYIETAAKLMRGNNETNTDFDIDNELIQKSQTTGARIDAWQDNLDMNDGTWDHGVAAAGGYIYRVGGRVDPRKPTIVSQQQTLAGSNTTSFVMDMPAARPAGDLYIALMCHDGSNGANISPPSGGGWTEYADLQGHAAYYKIGTNQGGGNEAASYTWTGPSEEWAGVIVRVTGFNSSDVVSGTAGTGSNSTGAVPVFPATTPDNDATLVVRAAGFDTDNPSTTTWVPSGHTKIDSSSSSSGGTGSCGFTAASLDVPPSSGVSTGTATHADSSVNDDYGASTIAINPATVSAGVQDTVYWAKFNSSTLAIESPNPGNGACSGWCTNSAYNLPEARRGFSLVAYNGYLYAIGGLDATGNRESTILIAKLGANGEPSLWHPSGGTPVYWYQDTGLNGSTARSYLAAVAYNNRMYILGGATNANTTGTATMEYADINPMGTLGSWSSGTALPSSRYMHTAHIYNDVLYLIGGDSGGSLQNSVYYNRLNSDGSMNSWTLTTPFSGPRSTMGGSFTAVWGAYIYLAGGCTTTTGAPNYYCGSSGVASDVQLASIHADGSISEWGSITNLENKRMGYNIIGWQGGLYRLGGCIQQNGSTGNCGLALADVDYGVINPDGEASTVGTSSASGASTCTGSDPYNCDLPSASVGNVLNASVVANGYLYIMGGCTSNPCNSYSSGITYQAIGSDGTLRKPASCAGTYTDSYCVSSTSLPASRGAAAPTVFNGRIYLVGGFPNRDDVSYASVNNDGSLGTWTSPSFASLGVSESLAYSFAYSRANPSSASTTPGNLFIFGGCDGNNGVGCSNYSSSVYKCNIGTSGAPSSCTTTGQLQIGTAPGASGPGLGAHAGAVYANYIYLMGGLAPNALDLTTVYYAKFNDSNNVVTAGSSGWTRTSNDVLVGRRRGAGFGYNGYLYVTGGYDGSEALADIEFAKIDVSTGDVGVFNASTVSISRRWGLTAPVSNSYAYVVGGCTAGSAPTGCTTRTNTIQTFQIYNNDSGALKSISSFSDDTFASDTDRWGASVAVLNGYLYVAGGCTSATDCTAATSNVQYAPISTSDGSIGTWSSATNGLPAVRAWGKLVAAGGGLYYLGGQSSTATDERAEVYYVSSFSSGDISAAWSTASGGIGDTASQAAQERTKFGTAVWNNRIYVVGGLSSAGAATNTVFISPQLTGGNIAADSWASDADVPDVARYGAAVVAYANNLYIFGGNDGTNYLNDAQFTQINSDGTVDAWTFTTSMSSYVSEAEAFAANGYIYLIGGRSAASSCVPNTLVAPISANTTIASGNSPTGIGEWYETNVRYAGGRYGAAVVYNQGKVYVTGGGCTSPQAGSYSTGTITQSGTTVTGSGTNWTDNYIGTTITYQDASTATVVSVSGATSMTVSVSKTIGSAQTYSVAAARHVYSGLKSQPQVAKYSRMVDTDTDVFPNSWLVNGLDNSIGARWQVRYRSMHDISTTSDTAGGVLQQNPNEDCGTSATMAAMTTWGQETNFGDVTLGKVEQYTPKNSSGGNINCARYYYFSVTIDASQTFGYPEDVTRGPTITDLSLFFTSDPSKRLRHGKTFTGGEQQPLDTPCRQSNPDPNAANCPLP